MIRAAPNLVGYLAVELSAKCPALCYSRIHLLRVHFGENNYEHRLIQKRKNPQIAKSEGFKIRPGHIAKCAHRKYVKAMPGFRLYINRPLKKAVT